MPFTPIAGVSPADIKKMNDMFREIYGEAKLVASGVENGWAWEKWSNGKAVCWGRFSGTFAMTTQSGGLYYTGASPVTPPAYPVGLFSEVPEHIQLTSDNYSVPLISVHSNDNRLGSKEQPPEIAGFRGTSNTVTGYYFMEVKGKWK